jgi:hypothetical protein
MKIRQYFAVTTCAVLTTMAVPAIAQSVSGQVNVHGFVAPRCGITFAGDSTFSGTINLGELAQSNGTMLPGLMASSTSSTAGMAAYFLGCSGATFNVTLSATRLANPGIVALAPASNIIDYTAEMKIALATGGFATVDYTTALPLPAPTTQLVNSFVSPVPGNLEVRVFAFLPDNGSTSVLIAGNYDSVITIVITPGA